MFQKYSEFPKIPKTISTIKFISFILENGFAYKITMRAKPTRRRIIKGSLHRLYKQ
jgi:hypothetical protein